MKRPVVRLASCLLTAFLFVLIFSFAGMAESEEFDSPLRWQKSQAKLVPWPSKGQANRIEAYRHLGAPEPDFVLFQFNRTDLHRVKDWELEIGTQGSLAKFSGRSLSLNCEFPDGSRRKVPFEVWPPSDEEHAATEADKVQWKIRNPAMLSLSFNGREFVVIDADVNGYFFDFARDRIAQGSASDIAKGTLSPDSLQFVPWESVFEYETGRFAIFTCDWKGNVQHCELPAVFTADTARALSYLNYSRLCAGAGAILPDPATTARLKEHAIYCSRSSITRIEDPKSVNYNAAAAKVARYALSMPAASAFAAVRSALCTLHGRTMLLSGKLKPFGMVLEGNVFCIGGSKSAWETDFSARYPLPGQVDVGLRNMPEEYSPLRAGAEGYSSPVVVLPEVPVTAVDVKAEIAEFRSGRVLKTVVSFPADPANADAEKEWPKNRGGITVVAEEPFMPGTIYRVKIVYSPEPGKDAQEVEWLFRTEEGTLN
ncbi:MAG: hypothetical protein Kow00107_04230 [Planctomycetota bacterium]